MKKRRIIAFVVALIAPLMTFAQEVDMADQLRQNGKIFVVTVVIGIIVTGLYAFLFYLDNKLSKLEKEIKAQ